MSPLTLDVETTMNGLSVPQLRTPGKPAAPAAPRQPDLSLAELKELTDGELMVRVKADDTDAFRVLVDRYKDPLVNYLTKLTRCRDRAEEYAQETFVRLFKVADRYEEKGQLAGYLYRIGTNLLRTDERRAKRWRTLTPTYRASQLNTEAPSPQRSMLSGEATDVVTAAIAALPLTYRAPLVMREIEGWSYKEIAVALDCREGTVKSRISRAKGKLRQALEPYWAESGHATSKSSNSKQSDSKQSISKLSR